MLTRKAFCPAGQEQAIQGATGSSGSSSGTHWQELLASPEPLTSFGGRAKSASDAGVLRRKGHLKEQDLFIEFLLHMHTTHTSEEVI